MWSRSFYQNSFLSLSRQQRQAATALVLSIIEAVFCSLVVECLMALMPKPKRPLHQHGAEAEPMDLRSVNDVQNGVRGIGVAVAAYWIGAAEAAHSATRHRHFSAGRLRDQSPYCNWILCTHKTKVCDCVSWKEKRRKMASTVTTRKRTGRKTSMIIFSSVVSSKYKFIPLIQCQHTMQNFLFCKGHANLQ